MLAPIEGRLAVQSDTFLHASRFLLHICVQTGGHHEVPPSFGQNGPFRQAPPSMGTSTPVM